MSKARFSILVVTAGLVAAGGAQNPQTLIQEAQKVRGAGTQAQAPARPAAAPQAPAAAPQAAQKPAPAPRPGARDPFVTLLKPKTEEGGGPTRSCPPGVRGLLVGQLELSGVVRTPTEMIAITNVAGSARTYFLREGNTLCNGRVAKITPDALIMEEEVIDTQGKTSMREVSKKIPAEAR